MICLFMTCWTAALKYITEVSTRQVNPVEASFILNWVDAADLFSFLPCCQKAAKVFGSVELVSANYYCHMKADLSFF